MPTSSGSREAEREVVDVDRITVKLSELEHRIDRIRTNRRASAAELEDDEDARDLLSFNLLLAVQCCLDIASHIIADQGWRPAAKLAESFERLGEHGVLGATTARAMQAGAGFRNVVAHGYGGVDLERLHSAATVGLADLESFARDVAVWLQTGAAGPPATSARP